MTRSKSIAGPAADEGRPYILESAEFLSYVEQKRTTAQRAAKDLQSEVDGLQTEIERIQHDAAIAVDKCTADMRARLSHLEDQQSVIAICDAALGVPVPVERRSPVISGKVRG